MNYSYWELKSWFRNVDFAIIGSGIVGLSTALHLNEKYPQSNILILEKGQLPQGASTKNAGFACFGSLSEIISDLKRHSISEVVDLVQKRWDGLNLLRETLGDTVIDFQQKGGYELFTENSDLFDTCYSKMNEINSYLNPVFKDAVFSASENNFQFEKIYPKLIFNKFEGQIDTGKMMSALLTKVQSKGVKILNNADVNYIDDFGTITLKDGFSFGVDKIILATNGFAQEFLDENVQPARAQVIITEPINDLHIKGTFHLDEGYYYFRNINNRILFGGGRNLNFKGEETTTFGTTDQIQNELDKLLQEVILPNKEVKIDHRWSGIMGVGSQKKAIVKQVSNNVFCAVRLGGMGVAIGSSIGKEVANIV
ncbi:NAD(P)/FAD-dependent oxidoreductase [Urechidicola vernalis]|uniref:FAD-dependent oxidoreductase n=1 Tax=Urechidicola vernalis TaxID=3075600 RepID=A0ABU2Y7Z2_9FLAO|nr:FAD-dependent oxidoreductase [Urechidicola sp. P050]MDT0553360.1 FAD-dependent oxidoreductase [Urechidicola sp. P050]